MAGHRRELGPDTQVVTQAGVTGPQKGVSPVWERECDLGGTQRGLQVTGNVLLLNVGWGAQVLSNVRTQAIRTVTGYKQ